MTCDIDTKATNWFAKEFPKAWKNWLEVHKQICTDPFVVDASKHMMIIAIKKDAVAILKLRHRLHYKISLSLNEDL